jgi:acyl carrier protein
VVRVSEQVEKIQEWLLDYLAQAVGKPAEDIGADVPFARYGLDSAAIIVMASTLMDWLGQDIDIDTLFEYPTVEALSRHLAARR